MSLTVLSPVNEFMPQFEFEDWVSGACFHFKSGQWLVLLSSLPPISLLEWIDSAGVLPYLKWLCSAKRLFGREMAHPAQSVQAVPVLPSEYHLWWTLAYVIDYGMLGALGARF